VGMGYKEAMKQGERHESKRKKSLCKHEYDHIYAFKKITYELLISEHLIKDSGNL
jgi:hypothetical protein